MLDFTNQVVLVTGAGSPKGIGRTIAQTFGKQGAKVVICDINQAGCDANVEEMKKRAPGQALSLSHCTIIRHRAAAAANRSTFSRKACSAAPSPWTTIFTGTERSMENMHMIDFPLTTYRPESTSISDGQAAAASTKSFTSATEVSNT